MIRGLSPYSSNQFFTPQKKSISILTDLNQKSFNKGQLSTQKFVNLNSLTLQQSQYDGNFNIHNNNNNLSKQFQNTHSKVNANNYIEENNGKNIKREITQYDIKIIKTLQQMILYQYYLHKQNQQIKINQNEIIKKKKDLIQVKKGQIQIQKDYYNRHLIKQYQRNQEETKMFKLKRYQKIKEDIRLLKKGILRINNFVDNQRFNKGLDEEINIRRSQSYNYNNNNSKPTNLLTGRKVLGNYNNRNNTKFQPHYHFHNINIRNPSNINNNYSQQSQQLYNQRSSSLQSHPQNLQNYNNYQHQNLHQYKHQPYNISSNNGNILNYIKYAMNSNQSTMNPQNNNLSQINLANGFANYFRNGQQQNHNKKQQQHPNVGNNSNIRVSNNNKSNSNNSNHVRQKSNSSSSIPKESSRSSLMKTAEKIDIFNLSPTKFNKKSSKSWEIDGQQNQVLQLLENSTKRIESSLQKNQSRFNYANSKIYSQENQSNIRKSQGNIQKVSIENKIPNKVTQSKFINEGLSKQANKNVHFTNSFTKIDSPKQLKTNKRSIIQISDYDSCKIIKTDSKKSNNNTLQLPKQSPRIISSINEHQSRTAQQILRQKELQQSAVQIIAPDVDLSGYISRDQSAQHNSSLQKDQQNNNIQNNNKQKKTTQFLAPPLPNKTFKSKSQKGNNQNNKQIEKLPLSQNKQSQINQSNLKQDSKSIETNRKNILNSQIKIQYDSFENSDQKINMTAQEKEKRQHQQKDQHDKNLKDVQLQSQQQIDQINDQDDVMGISLEPVSKISRQTNNLSNNIIKKSKIISTKNNESMRQTKSNSDIIKTSKQIKNSKIEKKQRKSSIQKRGQKSNQAEQTYQDDEDFFTQFSLEAQSKISKEKKKQKQEQQQQQEFGDMNSQLRSSTTSKVIKKGHSNPNQNSSISQSSSILKKTNQNNLSSTIKMDAVQQQEDEDLDGTEIFTTNKRQILSYPKIDGNYGTQSQQISSKPINRFSVPFS